MWKKEWDEAKDTNGTPMAEISNDGMKGARRLHLNMYFPENRVCIYEEHIKYVEEAINKFKKLLGRDT